MQMDSMAYFHATLIPVSFTETISQKRKENTPPSPVSDTNNRTLPEEILLLKYGKNSYTKDGDEGEFFFSPEDADTIIDEFHNRGKDLVIDFEHQSISGTKAPAAGWIKELRKSEEGLAGLVKYWTKEAEELILSGKYRYYSPVLYFSNGSGNVTGIHSVALTNHPALHNIPPLAASDLTGSTDTSCDREKETFFRTHRIKNFADANKLLSRAEEIVRNEKLQIAFSRGILTENMRCWANTLLKENPALFDLWCQTAPRIVPDNLYTDQARLPEEKPSPSALEKEIFSMLGLTENKN